MAMGKNKKPIYESRSVNMDITTNGAGFKATALRLSGTTPSSRGLNSLRHLPQAQVRNTQPISRNGDGITPLHYGYPAALTRKIALNTSTFEVAAPPSQPLLGEESMEASKEDRKVEQFPAWSPFDEPFITIDREQQPENVPPQVPVSSSYESLDCPNALNDPALFPRTLLSDSLNWPNFSHCLPSENNTPPPLPTTSPSESLHRTGYAHGLRSGNIPSPNPTHSTFGSVYLPYYPKSYGPVPATLPSWNPYWPSYPNGQGSENMVPPVPAYLPPLVPAGLPYGGGVYGPYYHGFGTIPSWSLNYPSVRPSQNIPPVPAPEG
ncbi:hypothetical protein N665_0795s0027 [Sinapis alba]|nr:hypothetical protein N665_0795s0027 [Sinapis alba]